MSVKTSFTTAFAVVCILALLVCIVLGVRFDNPFIYMACVMIFSLSGCSTWHYNKNITSRSIAAVCIIIASITLILLFRFKI